MEEIITLKCSTKNCNAYEEYEFQEENFTAIIGQWRNEESKGGVWDGMLPEQPVVGELYELFLSGALKIDLAQRFWVVYYFVFSGSYSI